jgi:hypothetical protein
MLAKDNPILFIIVRSSSFDFTSKLVTSFNYYKIIYLFIVPVPTIHNQDKKKSELKINDMMISAI